MIVGVHGVRGMVRVKPYTAEPASLDAYGPLTNASGDRTFRLRVGNVSGNVVLASIDGITDRDAAERLRGLELYVSRSVLPAPEEDEFYLADLIGLAVELEDGTSYGKVRSVDDYGAGDVIEIQPAAGGMPLVLPFTREFVPVVDLAGARIVVSPPEDLLRPGTDDGRAEEGRG